ncbi:MAG: glycosyltransferase [Syntrophaceae bacterium]
MKIILFYSSIGQGHISAARAIEQAIVRQNPEATVLSKDIRDFMDPVNRMLDEKIYWFVVKNLPHLFDAMFRSLQEQGNIASSLTWLPSDYPELRVLEYLKAENPDAVMATHYGSAQVLGNLREKALIPGIKIGWLHTDYFEGYFPRISMRIDRTFLAHPELVGRWVAAGVSPDLIETSGMPVNIPASESKASKKCLEQIGFDTDVKTITIASGKEGAGNFPSAVMSVAEAIKEPLQIIAVCGRNENQQQALHKILPTLPRHVKLKILGFIPQADLVAFIHASDVFITKAGGLSPAEAFTLGKPTILLNVISGHEKENAEFFSKLGMAEFNTDIRQLGAQVLSILSDPEKQALMLEAQKGFRANLDIGKIARFLLDPGIKARCAEPDFGLENGIAASNVHDAIEQLEADAPADIEILLSYSSSQKDERIVMENPFGHIAIRVGDTVYSANHVCDPANDGLLLQHMSLAQYLFGVMPPSENQVHTSTYGMAYGRDTLGLRIKGLNSSSLKHMHAEAARIEEEFRTGACKWDKYGANCADFVARILRAGGYDIEKMKGPSFIFTMPLDVFETLYAAFSSDAGYQTELTAYRRLPGSQASYRFSRFPLSLGQPVRSLARVITGAKPDKIEKNISRQLSGYIGDERIYYENLSARIATSELNDLDRSRIHAKSMEQILIEEARQLIAEQKILRVDLYRQRAEQHIMREFHYLIERCYEVARISTEHAQVFLSDPNIQTLQEAFGSLMDEYASLNLSKGEVDRLPAFIEKLSEFRKVIESGFSDADQKQHALASEVRMVSDNLQERFKSGFDIAQQILTTMKSKTTAREISAGGANHSGPRSKNRRRKKTVSPVITRKERP